MISLVPFKSLTRIAQDWYNKQCEPHMDDLPVVQQVVLMALEFGMPEVLQGDADGACFVVDLSQVGDCPQGMAGTSGLCTLWVTENLELTLIPVAGMGEPVLITPEQLIASYALVPVNPAILGLV